MSTNDAFLAFSRFGLGARPGDLAGLTGDPKAALLAEIADPTALFLDDAGLPSTIDAFALVRSFQKARQTQRKAANAAAGDAASAAPGPGMAAMAPDAGMPAGMTGMGSTEMAAPPGNRPAGGKPGASGKPNPALKADPSNPGNLLTAELAARLDRARSVPIGFGERLVAFWANHFAVQAAANEIVRGLAGAFEREAIRPNVLGSFGDLVLAATQHPAMLMSLNNASSIGPNSPQGQKTGKGLNENHARELMELHTVGVDGGYTQADVTAFAKVLTGWTFGRAENQPAFYGRFQFRKPAHEPGPQQVMGKIYAQRGIDQGEAVIADLANSAATARHIATKLARHFVADDPDPKLVAQLAGVFSKTHGDLMAVTKALVEAPEAWAAPRQKLKTPQEFLWSAVRALGLDPKPELIGRGLADLGQPLWNPPSPQGFKDDAATWLAPDAMTTRVEVAELLAAQDKSTTDPQALATDLFGTTLSPDTATSIGRAESRGQGIALLLMSPEFQRR